jgi:RimJ/RimL family protein N-acetyltransferase
MRALQPLTIAALTTYWTDFFACPLDMFDRTTTCVLPHTGLGDYHGLFLFRRKHTLIISVPPADHAGYLARFAGLTTAAFDHVAALTTLFPTAISHVIGPAWLGYADAGTFRPHQRSAARLLMAADEAAFLRFRAACPPQDWDHGGSVFGEPPLAGQFIGDTLVALAGYERWGNQIAHIAVVTHPDYRGQGYGTCVVSLLAETVLTQGLIPQYRTLRANTPSMAIAEALGFCGYAETIAIRLA